MRVPVEFDLVRLGAFIDEQNPGLRSGNIQVWHAWALPSGTRRYGLRDSRSRWLLDVLQSAGRASDDTLAVESSMLTALLGSYVPVPRVLASSPDPAVIGQPFLVREYLPGRPLEVGAGSAPRIRVEWAAAELANTLAVLHRTSPSVVGLGHIEPPENYYERVVDRWARSLETNMPGSSAEVRGLRRLLISTRPDPTVRLVNGDVRLRRFLFGAGGGLAGFVGWRFSGLGDPLVDLGLLVTDWEERTRTAVPGRAGQLSNDESWPDAADLVSRYERASGRRVRDLGWYLALGQLRLAADKAHEGAVARPAPGASSGPAVDRLLGRAASLLS